MPNLEHCVPRRPVTWAAIGIVTVAGLTWFVVTDGRASLPISAASIIALLACALPCSVPFVIARLWLCWRQTHAAPRDR